MIDFEKEGKEVLDSMKGVLKKINKKLEEESTLEDAEMTKRFQDKKKWVKDRINDWEKFIS